MKMTLSTSDIANELRGDSDANWSNSGAYALAEYLEQYEEDSGEEMEFDRVAIRCDFSEHQTLEHWARDYFADWKADLAIDEDDSAQEMEDKIREHIQDNGQLIEFDGGIIVSSF